MRADQEKFQKEMRELITGSKKKNTENVHIEEEGDTSSKKNGEGENQYQENEEGPWRNFEKGKGGGNRRYRKIEMPLFEGETRMDGF